jgi:Ring finger domain
MEPVAWSSKPSRRLIFSPAAQFQDGFEDDTDGDAPTKGMVATPGDSSPVPIDIDAATQNNENRGRPAKHSKLIYIDQDSVYEIGDDSRDDVDSGEIPTGADGGHRQDGSSADFALEITDEQRTQSSSHESHQWHQGHETVPLKGDRVSSRPAFDDIDVDEIVSELDDILNEMDDAPFHGAVVREDGSGGMDGEEVEVLTESDEARRQREEQQSLELAQMLMAEESMAAYDNHFAQIQANSEFLTEDERAALEAAMAEERREFEIAAVAEELEQELDYEDGNLSYDTLLRLGEHLGDVKEERWKFNASRYIEQLATFRFCASNGPNEEGSRNDSETKCLVCQCEYEDGEDLKRLPCSHCFHSACVDQWLQTKDWCPYCRHSIVASANTNPARK